MVSFIYFNIYLVNISYISRLESTEVFVNASHLLDSAMRETSALCIWFIFSSILFKYLEAILQITMILHT